MCMRLTGTLPLSLSAAYFASKGADFQARQVLLHVVHLVEAVCQCDNITVLVFLDHDIAVAHLALSTI